MAMVFHQSMFQRAGKLIELVNLVIVLLIGPWLDCTQSLSFLFPLPHSPRCRLPCSLQHLARSSLSITKRKERDYVESSPGNISLVVGLWTDGCFRIAESEALVHWCVVRVWSVLRFQSMVWWSESCATPRCTRGTWAWSWERPINSAQKVCWPGASACRTDKLEMLSGIWTWSGNRLTRHRGNTLFCRFPRFWVRGSRSVLIKLFLRQELAKKLNT